MVNIHDIDVQVMPVYASQYVFVKYYFFYLTSYCILLYQCSVAKL